MGAAKFEQNLVCTMIDDTYIDVPAKGFYDTNSTFGDIDPSLNFSRYRPNSDHSCIGEDKFEKN
jgi:hypothetical protein